MIKTEKRKCGICSHVLLRKDWLDYDFMRIYGDLKVVLKNLFIAQVLLEYHEMITTAKKKTNEKKRGFSRS